MKCYFCNQKVKRSEAVAAWSAYPLLWNPPVAHPSCREEFDAKLARLGELKKECAAQEASEKKCPFPGVSFMTGKCLAKGCLAWTGKRCARIGEEA